VRLFVALQIPSAVRDNLSALIDELRNSDRTASGKKPRWVRPENLHVTLKFIGEAPAEKLDAIRAALSSVRSAHSVELRFHGLGFFPNANRPRVLWAGMDAPSNLGSLAVDVDQAVAAEGFPRETHAFAPHLTLARLDPPGISRELRAAVETKLTRDFGILHTAEFHLIQSKLKSTGAEYTTLQTFPFASEA
jgi:RNA 2',3'-cyclic 3'-phosphodiesterase